MSKTLRASFFVLAASLLVASYMFTRIANANPDQITDSYFGSAAATTSASTVFLNAISAATTTNTTDTQADGGLPAKSATLLVALTGSSSSAFLNISLEFSQNNLDWYGDLVSVPFTATSSASLNTPQKFTLPAGTSTNSIGGNGGVGNTIYRAFTIAVPTRYVRAIFSIASSTIQAGSQGASNASVWSDIVAKKETR